MRKIVCFIVIISLCLGCFSFSVSAESNGNVNSNVRLMPANFVFTDSISLGSGNEFPPGYANFDVRISGKYDLQGNNIISIDVKNCTYRGGVNCEEHDLSVTAYMSPSDNGVVLWKLTGSLVFSWTSPVTGVQYETVRIDSPLYSFNGLDYVV